MRILIPLLTSFLLFFMAAPAQAGQTGNKPSAPAAQNLTYAYFPTAVPVAVIAEVIKRDNVLKKALTKLRTPITFQPFTKGNDVIALVAQNKISVVAMSDMPVIEATVTSNMQIIGIVKQSYASVIAPHGTLLKDLHGKKIGNAFGSTSHYALLQALKSVGMTEKDISIIPLDVNEMADALASKKIDAFAAWEPTPTVALQKYPDRFSTLHKQISFSYFMISQQLVNKAPQTAREITAALVRAIRWMKKDNANLALASRWTIEEMKNFTGKAPALTELDIAHITRSDLLDVASAPLFPKTDLNATTPLSREFEFLKKIGKLPPDSTWEKVHKSLNNKLLREVMAKPKEFALNKFEYGK